MLWKCVQVKSEVNMENKYKKLTQATRVREPTASRNDLIGLEAWAEY